MYITILFLPILGAVIAGFFGRTLGGRGAGVITVFNMFITWILAISIFVEVIYYKCPTYIQLWNWAMVQVGFDFDFLTAVMLVVVTSISLMVHLYSTEYMGGDPHLPRFMSYLSLFTWFMLILVTSSNLLQLFIGWEGVGVCSYLLINFWFTRIQANKAAMKAMIVNRVGDVGVVIAILLCYSYYGSVEYSVIFNTASNNNGTIIGLMLLIGTIGKSAQIGLHTWLPDAMEGPTPVSALIHAATMVTAGVFLLLRSNPLWETSPIVVMAIAIVGAVTAFFGATVGLVQNDIKKVIAYSTCSQLGYMVFACGVSAYSTSLFHLFNHAFFKALLFLSAGSVIHALADEQDLRKMGAILFKQPLTYTAMLIGSLALMGTPFLTGFYSKDAIIEFAYAAYNVQGTLGHWLLSLSAGMTAFYSMRLLHAAFFTTPQGTKTVLENAHEPGIAMSLPLVLLTICSIYIGYVMKDMMVGVASPYLEFVGKFDHHHIESEFMPTFIKWIPVIFSAIGAFLGIILYPFKSSSISKDLYTYLNNKWHFDLIYNSVFVKPIMDLGYSVTYKILDRGVIEEIGPSGIVNQISRLSRLSSIFQSGQIYHYCLIVLIGTILFILI